MTSDYPVTFNVEYPERLSRGLIFVKWLLVIPHAIILLFYGLAVGFTTFIAWWAILFTGKYPRELFDFAMGYLRWALRVSCYSGWLFRDKYPPFSTD
jgi:hypothetical protein